METTPRPIKVYIHWTNHHTMYDATGQPVPLPTHAEAELTYRNNGTAALVIRANFRDTDGRVFARGGWYTPAEIPADAVLITTPEHVATLRAGGFARVEASDPWGDF